MTMRIVKAKQELNRVLTEILKQLGFFSAALRFTDVSKDLRYVTFEIASVDDHISTADLVRLINKKAWIIKKNLNIRIKFRSFPIVRFVEDTHQERVARMEKLMLDISGNTILTN